MLLDLRVRWVLKRGFLASLAALFVAASILSPGVPASGQGQRSHALTLSGSDEPPRTRTNAERRVATGSLSDPRLRNQADLTAAADRLQRLATGPGGDAWAGTQINHRTDSVVLYWDGPLPRGIGGAVREVRSNSVRVDVRSVDYSLQELDREARRIAALDPEQVGAKITGVGVRSDYSGLEVSVARSKQIPAAEASIVSRYELTFRSMPEAEPAAWRWDDTPPFWGGAAIDHRTSVFGSYAYCTTGFAVKSSSTENIITARHCGPAGWDWNTPIGDRFVGDIGSGRANIDAALLSGADYSPHIYVGPWDSSTSRTVVGSGNPPDESFVFASGSWSGASVLRVKSVNQYAVVNGVRVGPGFWTRDEELDGSVGQGDSGGPTASGVGTGNDVKARGMIDAIDTSTQRPCLGRTDGDRICAFRAFHVNISAILNGLSRSIQKG